MHHLFQDSGVLSVSLSHLDYDSSVGTIIQVSSKYVKAMFLVDVESSRAFVLEEFPEGSPDLKEVYSISDRLVLYKTGESEIATEYVNWIVDGLLNEGMRWQMGEEGRVFFLKPISRFKHSGNKSVEAAEAKLFPRVEIGYESPKKDESYCKSADYLYGEPSSKKKKR